MLPVLAASAPACVPRRRTSNAGIGTLFDAKPILGAQSGRVADHVRAKRADRVKLLVWDGSGLVLVWKQLQQGAFQWPPAGWLAAALGVCAILALPHAASATCRCTYVDGQQQLCD
ncbi:MAG: IS66 family insertion sequence element accessory protein TnpB [Janthinobacterium lividum]